MIFNEDEKIILRDCGLTSTQSKVYLSLIVLGTSSAGEIIKFTNIANPDVYRATEVLQSKGLIEKIISNPAKFQPLPVIDAIEQNS